MTNYMYHQNKETHIDLDTIDSQMWQRYENVTMDNYWEGKIFYTNESISSNYNINTDIIYEICNKYSMFGNYIVINELSKLGVCTLHINKNNLNINYNSFIKDAIIGEIIYTMLRRI